MKTRKGFVSNSSSSSFVIYRKNKDLSKEELIKRTTEVYKNYYGIEYVTENYEEIEALADNNEYCVAYISVEWGGENGVEMVSNILLKELNVNEELFRFEWEE